MIRIGTSGWSYPHWSGRFYPERLGADAWLGYYAERFDTVEINATFYRLPSEQTVAEWASGVPEGFLFAVKASRYITHMKKLKDPDQTLPPFFDRVAGLGKHLGPVLFQTPPRWRVNLDRLAAFLESLPRGLQYAFEFRDPSWHSDGVRTLLEKHGAAFCVFQLEAVTAPDWVTAGFAYVRLHGPHEAYAGRYSSATLKTWAGRLKAWEAAGVHSFCYFDNDQAAQAPRDAARLMALLG